MMTVKSHGIWSEDVQQAKTGSKSLNLEDSLKKQEKVKMIVMRSLRGRFKKPRDVSGAVSAQFSIHKTPYF